MERLNPYRGKDLPWLLETQVQARGGQRFLVWEPKDGPTVELTYAQFASRARQVAHGLKQRGVTAGDRVLIHADNSPEFLFSWMACAELGATAVTTNTKSSAAELEYFAGHAGVVGAITQPRFFEMVSSRAGDL